MNHLPLDAGCYRCWRRALVRVPYKRRLRNEPEIEYEIFYCQWCVRLTDHWKRNNLESL